MKKFTFALFLSLWSYFSYAQVTIYSECNYRGKYRTLSAKTYANHYQFGLQDNSISSIKIAQGYSVDLYQNSNMTGRKITLTSSDNCLPSIINNSVSSIVVKKIYNDNANSGNISIYRNCGYRGSVTNFPTANYPDLRAKLNGETPESLQIPNGMVAEFYSGTYYSGRLLGRYTSNQNCLTSEVRDFAKSLKVYKNTSENEVKPQPK